MCLSVCLCLLPAIICLLKYWVICMKWVVSDVHMSEIDSTAQHNNCRWRSLYFAWILLRFAVLHTDSKWFFAIAFQVKNELVVTKKQVNDYWPVGERCAVFGKKKYIWNMNITTKWTLVFSSSSIFSSATPTIRRKWIHQVDKIRNWSKHFFGFTVPRR